MSDATVEIAAREGGRWEPLDEIDPGSRVALGTDRDVASVIADLAETLEQCLPEPVEGETSSESR